MSHQQFYRYCHLQAMDPDIYEAVVYPDAYLLIWLECKRQANPVTGATSYPEPDKGYLQQDADLMLAFEVLDEIQDRRHHEESQRAELKKQTSAYFGGPSD